MLREFVQLAKKANHHCHSHSGEGGHGHSHSHGHRHSHGAEPANDMLGARMSSIFVVLVTSGFGALFPIVASRCSFVKLPSWVFFFCKFFGSGVIIATAFIHLLFHANLHLSGACLGEAWSKYPYAFGIMLLTLFALFLSELIAFRYVEKKIAKTGGDGHSHSHFGDEAAYVDKGMDAEVSQTEDNETARVSGGDNAPDDSDEKCPSHFSHAAELQDKEALDTPMDNKEKEQYYGQLVAILVLEFGILFHSVFVGLTLGASGEEFTTLYIVIVFHQFFEGLGLGSRIATTIWPKGKRWTPWVFATGFMLVTPISTAAGLAMRQTFKEGSPRVAITSGVLDSISAGILIYTGLVELMAHEFLFSNEFKGDGGFKRMMWAFFHMCLGCGLMSLLGKWE